MQARARVAELVRRHRLKTDCPSWACGFESHPGHCHDGRSADLVVYDFAPAEDGIFAKYVLRAAALSA